MESKPCVMCKEGKYTLVIDGSSLIGGELNTWWGNTIGCYSDQGFSKTVKIYKCDKCGNLQICNPE